MKRSILITSIIAILLVPTSAAFASGGQSPWIEAELALTNQERKQRGIAELTVNTSLEWAAATKLSDMEKGGYFAHTSPTGLTPWSFMDKVGYEYHYAGENLAIHFNDPTSEHVAWMQSEKHCQNILDPRFSEIGMAVKKTYFEGRETMIVVAMFGTRSGREVATKLTKEDALTLCKGGIPSVSGTSDERQSDGLFSGGSVGSISSSALTNIDVFAKTETENRYGFVELISTVVFTLAQVVVISLLMHLVLSHETRDGVYLS